MGHVIIKRFIFAAVVLAMSACVTYPTEAAEFELRDENNSGAVYNSRDYLGTPMVLEFYFNGCPACERNSANIARLANEYHGTTAQVVEISIDCEDDVYSDWIRRHNAHWPVLNDCSRRFSRNQGVSSYPTTLVLDSRHRVVYRTNGIWSAATYARIARLISSP